MRTLPLYCWNADVTAILLKCGRCRYIVEMRTLQLYWWNADVAAILLKIIKSEFSEQTNIGQNITHFHLGTTALHSWICFIVWAIKNTVGTSKLLSTDQSNVNASILLDNGSKNRELKIRELNILADQYSKIFDFDDWSVADRIL
jgi:hypothetical protein